MGFVKLLARGFNKGNVRALRKLGRHVAPGMTKSAEGFIRRHRKKIDAVGDVLRSGRDLADAATTFDIENGITAAERGIKAGRRLGGAMAGKKRRRQVGEILERPAKKVPTLSGGQQEEPKSVDDISDVQRLSRLAAA